jgi:hypothetical protein
MRKALKLSVLLGVSYNIARGFTSNSEENPINSKNQFKYGFFFVISKRISLFFIKIPYDSAS